MFRAQQNQFDDLIAKATDENLTSENWEYMMDAWDKVNESGDNGAKDAVAALIKRLAHRNANVQLYTLELAHAFSQNCGKSMHRELCSRSFTEALLRLAGDRNTHQAVKTRILERMNEWTEMFKSDPDLGIMEQAYHRLKSQNPNLQPPSRPNKREMTDLDRQKEEEELQMALAISLQETSRASSSTAQPAASSSSAAGPSQQRQKTPPPSAPHTTAATVSRVRALYDFTPTEPGELPFKKGDTIAVLESVYKDWWKGSLRGQVGIFPLNYVEKLSDPTAEELQRDAQTEAEVFGQVKNVEKLLALLSTSGADTDVQHNEEITALYHSTLAIRPKLIELIGKYSQKKDDFVALNEKFIKARRDYEALLENSMAHPQAGYGRPSYYNSSAGAGSGDGYNPQQPQSYYAPNPAASPSIPHAYSPTVPNAPYPVSAGPQSRPTFPPEGPGNAFYLVGAPGSGGAGPSGPPSDYHRPGSTHPPVDAYQQPQELATSTHDTPLDSQRPSHYDYGQGGRPVSPARPGGYQAYQRPSSTYYSRDEPPRSPGQGSTYGAPSAPYGAAPGSPGQPQDFYRRDDVYLREGRRA